MANFGHLFAKKVQINPSGVQRRRQRFEFSIFFLFSIPLCIPSIVSEHPYFILFLFLAGKRLSDASIYVRIPPPQSERRDGFQSGFHTRGARWGKVEERKNIPPRFPLFFSLGTSCPKGHKNIRYGREREGEGGKSNMKVFS